MRGSEGLVQALIERQVADGLTDADLARRLGVTRSAWSHLKAGRRGVGYAVVRGARRAYPDLVPDWLIFLADDVPTGYINESCRNGSGVAEAAS